MRKEELYTKEGLFITELTDEFFEKYISEHRELEPFVLRISDKAKTLHEQQNSGIWHCIFESLIRELCPGDFKMWHGYNPESDSLSESERILKEKILEFYNDPFFIIYDIAQKITYNLYRLGKDEIYNMENEDDIEYLVEDENINELLSIGRKNYGNDENKDKNIVYDLIDDLERLWKNNIVQESPVYFPTKIDRESFLLECDFLPLNILFIGNEKFQDFLFHKRKNLKCFEMLMKQIQILEAKNIAPLQYIWEKLTNFNTTSVIAKFLMILIKEERKGQNISQKEIKNIVEKEIPHKLFYLIRFMPNVLTKLLVVKTVFNYIGEYLISLNYDTYRKSKEELENSVYLKTISSDSFLNFLNRLNNCYMQLQEHLLLLATILRWNIDKKSKGKWIAELEKEYPMDLFKTLYLSLNINDDLRIRNVWKDYKHEQIDLNNKEYKCLIIEYKNRPQYYIPNLQRKCKLLNKFKDKKYSRDSKELAKELYQEGWGTIDECIKKVENGLNSEVFIQWDDSPQNINRSIKHCLLSDYKNIIFENTETEDEGLYKTIMNCLLNYSPSDLEGSGIITDLPKNLNFIKQ